MGIDRSELYEGGRAYRRIKLGAGQAERTLSVKVIEVMANAACVETEKGQRAVCSFNELLPDQEYLDGRDKQEEEKAARIKREALLLAEPPKPLTATLADQLKSKGVLELVSKPPPSQPPPPPPPPALELTRDERYRSTGERLALVRKLRCMSAKQVSESAGVHYSSIYNFESGKATPKPLAVLGLARAMNVAVWCLDASKPLPKVLPLYEGPKSEEEARALVARNCKAVREHYELSCEDFGALVGVSGVCIGYWEKGKSLPMDESLAKLCKAADVTEQQVMGLAPLPFEPKQTKLQLVEARREHKALPESERNEYVHTKPVQPKPKFDELLEMARKMVEPLRSERATLRASMAPLEQRLEDLRARDAELTEQILAIESMLKKREAAA